MNLVCRYTPEEHELITPTMLEWCKRNLPEPERLFMYRHRQWGTFVLAQWVGPQRTQFVDVMNLGTSLNNFTYERARGLLDMFDPQYANRLKQHLKHVDSSFRHHQTDEVAPISERFHRGRSSKVQIGMGS